MQYAMVKQYKDGEFRRLRGVKRPTFNNMISILRQAEEKKKAAGGKPNKLSMEARLLMSLEYLRAYRTDLHIAAFYGISEGSCYRNIKWIEDILIRHPDFALPGRKALLKSDIEYQVVLIDTTESPIERPQKSKNTTIQARKKDTL